MFIRLREEARAGGFTPALVDTKFSWGRPAVRGAKVALGRRQNEVLAGFLDLPSAASCKAVPFVWLQKSQALLFKLPPISRGVGAGCLSAQEAKACQCGTIERNLMSILCLKGLIPRAILPLKRCRGAHVYSCPDAWGRSPLARNT